MWKVRITIMENFIRHGDRNLRRIDRIGLKQIPKLKPSSHKIVGVGESTHKHKINGQCIVYDLEKPMEYNYEGRNILVDQFVDVLEDTTIQHEEHRMVPIEKGQYALVPEREVDILEQKIKMVMD